MAIDGDLIRQAREARGKSQAWLADKIARDQTYVSKVEKDIRKAGIKGDELLIIAKELEYDPYVFSGDLTLDEGDLRKHPRRDDLSEIRKALADMQQHIVPEPPSTEDERILERVRASSELRELLEMVQFWPGDQVRRFRDIAYGFVQGRRLALEEDDKKESAANA